MTRGATSPNSYELLAVAPSATLAEIKGAHRRLALETHPDRNGGSEDAAERFRAVQGAYEELRDPVRRRALDERLARDVVERKVRAYKARARAARSADQGKRPSTPRERTNLRPSPVAAEAEIDPTRHPFLYVAAKASEGLPPEERFWWLAGGLAAEFFRTGR